MELRVDASEISAYATRLGAAPGLIRSELSTTVRAVAVEGVGLAQGYAPVDTGALRGGIALLSSGGMEASYGVRGIVYARMREFGGTIVGRPWLVFRTKSGNWVKVRSVTQTGSRYMQRSLDALRPRAEAAFGAALQRIVARIGG